VRVGRAARIDTARHKSIADTDKLRQKIGTRLHAKIVTFRNILQFLSLARDIFYLQLPAHPLLYEWQRSARFSETIQS
jgi:hypothetical protein